MTRGSLQSEASWSSDDLLDDDPRPKDACGVFGVWAPGEAVSKLTYYGLYALQHRGQESAGIAVSNGRQIVVFKDMGLVSQVFDEPTLESLKGHLAIGHCRYSTTGSSTWRNAQPTFRSTAIGSVALGHNGNLTNTGDLLARATSGDLDNLVGPEPALLSGESSTSDTGLLTALLASQHDRSLEEAAMLVLPLLRGAFSLVFMDEGTSTPPVTRRASGRWSSAGSSAAGSSPARPRPSTSSAPRSSARSSRAS